MRLIYIICIALFVGCKERMQQMAIGGLTVKGEISADSIYNGKIDFFDSTGTLVASYNYKSGKREGQGLEYYKNGKKSFEGNFKDDLMGGTVKIFDSSGSLSFSSYYYYGLRVGPVILYSDSLPFQYQFYSFDNDLLFLLNIEDTSKIISDSERKFFFYSLDEDHIVTQNGLQFNKYKLFLYNINPPIYSFNYSVVLINERYEVLKKIHLVDKEKIWDEILLDTEPEAGVYAIQLEIIDPRHGKSLLYKKLEIPSPQGS